MSNRILWFLLLLWVLGFGYLFYLIFFVSYTWTFEITSNVDNYSVKMYAKKIAQTYNYECKMNPCKLDNISPFDYNVTISSPTYKDYVSEIVIKGKTINTLKADLVKDTKLSYIESNNENTSTWEIMKDQIDAKVDDLKLKKWTNYFINLVKLGYFYIKTNWNSLDVYRNINWKENKLGNFPKVWDNDMQILPIYGNTSNILISLWIDKYIYNLDTSKIINFKLSPKLNYIKIWSSFDNYLLVTDLWTFTYNYGDTIPKFFYLFKDFVYSSWSYIWVIYKDEKDKFSNFSLKNNNKNVIIKYNSIDLQRKIILETDLNVAKIVYEWEEIYFYDSEGKRYKLENY